MVIYTKRLTKQLRSESRGEAYFRGKVYPDNSYTVGYVPAKKKRVADERYDSEYESQLNSYECTVVEFGRTVRKEVKFFDRGATPSRFINSTESSQEKRKYGKKGITAYGKRVVSNSALLLQKHFGRRRLGFATATIPPVGFEASRIIIEAWGEITRRFFQELKRIFQRGGKEFVYVGCTEIQERRFVREGIAFPHLHWVYNSRGRSGKAWNVSANDIRSTWARVVIRVCESRGLGGLLSADDFQASIDCQVVKKSANSYLGKYLSKGAKVVKAMQEKGYAEFPKQWWFASAIAKKMFADSIVRLSPNAAFELFYNSEKLVDAGVVKECRCTSVEFGGAEFVVGVSGVFEPGYEAFLDCLE